MPSKQFFRPDIESDVDEELASHLEMREQELVKKGHLPAEARKLARAAFGNVAAVARTCREIDEGVRQRQRRASMWRDLRQDVAYGVRLLGRAPGFTVVAVLTLALGIAGSTAIFSVIDATLLRPLPYRDPEQLAEILIDSRTQAGRVIRFAPSFEDVRAWREHTDIFSHVAIWRDIFGSVIVDGPELERLAGRDISEDYLPLHGITPLLGRGFAREDANRGSAAVIMLGFGYWQNRFGRDPGVVGRTLNIDGSPSTIVGVLPRNFYQEVPIWRPYGALERDSEGGESMVYARVRAGVTIAQAQRMLRERTRARDTAAGTNNLVVQSRLNGASSDYYRRTTDVLAAAVAAILLIACINVAGLLLARGATRREELGVRASLGAGRFRLVRQLLAESLVLAVLGGALGALLAWTSLDALVANIPLSMPENSEPALNLRVLSFTMVLTLGTGLVFGLAPAWSLSRVDVSRTLVRGNQPRRFLSRRGGQILIAAEVALCIVLLTGAGLMIRSFALMLSVDVGFDPDAVLTMDVSPIDKSQPALKQYYPALVESLRHVPGVAAAGAVSHMPLQSASPVTRGSVDGGAPVSLHVREFIVGYFEAIGLRVEQGRLPGPAEMAGAAPAVVINERAAREMFGLKSPIGRRFELSRRGAFEVAAVVSNVLHSGPMKPPDPEVYLPFGADQARAMIVVIRPSGKQHDLFAHLRRAAQSIGPRAVVQRIRTGTELFDQRVLTPRRRMVLLTLLGTLGFVLSMVGVFGMTAYAVAQRTQEVGVRIALGARAEQVVGAIVRESLVPALIGIVVGSAAAAVTTGVIASFLFETRPVEPVTFGVVASVVGLAVTLAAWVPARRAARVDPISALRVT